MHMEMKYCLTGDLTVILNDIEAVTVQSISEFRCHFLCKDHCLACCFILKFVDIRCV